MAKFSHLCLSFDKDARAISPSKLERKKEKGRGGVGVCRGEENPRMHLLLRCRRSGEIKLLIFFCGFGFCSLCLLLLLKGISFIRILCLGFHVGDLFLYF
ncbi:hypothetical protein SO802_008277 [Lithocarpus litseifolius]|uniref:Transmembrane protein n=1 Tax=Lithocarpus litseifolius TaxID=425828 RepID=A0AAW2DC33_9ROSI